MPGDSPDRKSAPFSPAGSERMGTTGSERGATPIPSIPNPANPFHPVVIQEREPASEGVAGAPVHGSKNLQNPDASGDDEPRSVGSTGFIPSPRRQTTRCGPPEGGAANHERFM